ncbi:MAG: helix-turn-helix domain-containing protein [Treponema sp.]|jgi:transcriptional regulator with XRE-family HTH domain|nr:helix-turn-helix domain-containing protein [Treponema sp.]
MESLGKRLIIARENKGCTVDQVVQDTHIKRQYLEAFEAENFSVFPGEPYIHGFLRSYGEYLGLDGSELINAYKALTIDEHRDPDPFVRLRSHIPIKILALILIGFIVLAIAVIMLYIRLTRPKPVPVPVIQTQFVPYVMEQDFLERTLYVGDTVIIPVRSERYSVRLLGVQESVSISIPGSILYFDVLEEPKIADLDGDDFEELSITVLSFTRHNPESGVQVRFILTNSTAVIESSIQNEEPVLSQEGYTVLLDSLNPYPFTVQVQFIDSGLLRWEILSEAGRGRNQDYFQQGTVFNITAQNGIRFWVSNAGSIQFQLYGRENTRDFYLGAAGEIAVSDVRWIRSKNRSYLTVAQLN